MSDIDTPISDASVDSSPAPMSDAAAVEAVPAPDANPQPGSDAPEGDFSFDDADYDKIFGLEPEEAPPVQTPDVPEATDQPAPRQGDQPIETEAAPEEVETPAAEEASESKDAVDGQFKADEKLDFTTAPKEFRETYEQLKSAFVALAETHPQVQYVQDPAAFQNWMKETSPTSYNEIGKLLATESAEAHPREWADYLAQTNPDLLAQVVTGREDMTADRLKAELAWLGEDDESFIQQKMEEQKNAAETSKETKAPVEETPEQARIRQILEREEQQERHQVTQTVLEPINIAVNSLVSQAGLEVNLQELEGKDISQLDEETQFRYLVNQMLPVYIGMEAERDPKIQAMQARLEAFIEKKDVQSARSLQHPAQIFATNKAAEFLAIMTGRRARTKQQETTPPNTTPPKPQVKSAGASTNGFQQPVPTGGEIDWSADMTKW